MTRPVHDQPVRGASPSPVRAVGLPDIFRADSVPAAQPGTERHRRPLNRPATTRASAAIFLPLGRIERTRTAILGRVVARGWHASARRMPLGARWEPSPRRLQTQRKSSGWTPYTTTNCRDLSSRRAGLTFCQWFRCGAQASWLRPPRGLTIDVAQPASHEARGSGWMAPSTSRTSGGA